MASPIKNILDLAARFQPMIRAAAVANGLRPELLNGVITQESFWNPNAIRGEAHLASASIGLGQLLPSTAQLTPLQLKDPALNIKATAAYLGMQLRRYSGDEAAAVAAYNAGRAVRLKAGQRFCEAWKSTAPKTGRSLDRDCASIYVAPADGAFGNQRHVEKVLRYVAMFETATRTDPRYQAGRAPAVTPPVSAVPTVRPTAARPAAVPTPRKGAARLTIIHALLLLGSVLFVVWWTRDTT